MTKLVEFEYFISFSFKQKCQEDNCYVLMMPPNITTLVINCLTQSLKKEYFEIPVSVKKLELHGF
jgi:hypothetical protein